MWQIEWQRKLLRSCWLEGCGSEAPTYSLGACPRLAFSVRLQLLWFPPLSVTTTSWGWSLQLMDICRACKVPVITLQLSVPLRRLTVAQKLILTPLLLGTAGSSFADTPDLGSRFCVSLSLLLLWQKQLPQGFRLPHSLRGGYTAQQPVRAGKAWPQKASP